MKLLFLTFYFEPDLSAGSFRATALIKELSKFKDFEISVITTQPNRYASFEAKAPEYEERDNVTIHRIALPSHQSGMVDQAKAFTHFYHGAQKIVKHQEYDGVFGTSSRLFTAFLTARIAKTKRTPYYLDIRDIFTDTLEDLLSRKTFFFAKPILKAVERYSFLKATTINLVSEGFKEYFQQRFPDVRYQWFTNGIDQEFIAAIKKQPEKHSSIQNEHRAKTILYAGNIGEGQGLHHIVPQLAGNLGAEWQFKIIGDGGQKAALEDATKNLHNAELCLPVQRAQLIEEYKKADVLFLHLNDCKAFEKVLPSKIFEYATMGKPMLAGVAGFAAEFIQEEVSNAETFEPTDAIEAERGLKRLSLLNVERREFIEKFERQGISKKLAKDIASALREKP